MPITFRVGYRSPLVSAVAWLLMAVGLSGLCLLGYWMGHVNEFSAAEHLRWSIAGLVALLLVSGTALTAGQGLLRRLEWARRLSLGLLALFLVSLPALPWLAGSPLVLGISCLVVSAGLLWALRALNSMLVRQEFA
jgi:hypothetical protein